MNESGVCEVRVPPKTDDGSPSDPPGDGSKPDGSTSSPPVKRVCRDDGQVIPCVQEGTGNWWSSTHRCYVGPMAFAPPKSNPVWRGNTEGAIYSCLKDSSGGMTVGGPNDGTMRNHTFWSLNPPDGWEAVLPDPRTLADEAIAKMHLRAPKIGIAPDDAPGSVGLVGLPVWMWVDDPGKATTGPSTATASSGGHSVTATAKVTKLTWNMGDGSKVKCSGKGTKYDTSFGITQSPDCGHQYSQMGEYDVQVTATWSVEWSGLGQSGTIPMELERSTSIQIGEAQAVVKSTG